MENEKLVKMKKQCKGNYFRYDASLKPGDRIFDPDRQRVYDVVKHPDGKPGKLHFRQPKAQIAGKKAYFGDGFWWWG